MQMQMPLVADFTRSETLPAVMGMNSFVIWAPSFLLLQDSSFYKSFCAAKISFSAHLRCSVRKDYPPPKGQDCCLWSVKSFFCFLLL